MILKCESIKLKSFYHRYTYIGLINKTVKMNERLLLLFEILNVISVHSFKVSPQEFIKNATRLIKNFRLSFVRLTIYNLSNYYLSLVDNAPMHFNN